MRTDESQRRQAVKNRAWIVPILFLSLACAKKQPLDKQKAIELIGSSAAWQGPGAPQIQLDPSFHASPTTKRELLKLQIVQVKDDGPWGMAGQTATAVFTWRWLEGYATGRVFRTTAKLNNSGDGWKVYDEKLKEALWAAERGDID
jgi:hypothetical protein